MGPFADTFSEQFEPMAPGHIKIFLRMTGIKGANLSV